MARKDGKSIVRAGRRLPLTTSKHLLKWTTLKMLHTLKIFF